MSNAYQLGQQARAQQRPMCATPTLYIDGGSASEYQAWIAEYERGWQDKDVELAGCRP